jgi:hypothetical protein
VRDEVHAFLERRKQLAVLEQAIGDVIRHASGLPSFFLNDKRALRLVGSAG